MQKKQHQCLMSTLIIVSQIYLHRKRRTVAARQFLNLEFLNKECYTQHLRMGSTRHAIYMMKPEMFFVSLDIKVAFYSVPIYHKHQTFPKFLVKGKPLQLNDMSCESLTTFSNQYLVN